MHLSINRFLKNPIKWLAFQAAEHIRGWTGFSFLRAVLSAVYVQSTMTTRIVSEEIYIEIYTRSVNKVMRLIQYNSVLTFKLQIELVAFKIIPLGGYTPPETLFPIFVATLVVANRNRFYWSVTAFSMFSTVPKWRPLR